MGLEQGVADELRGNGVEAVEFIDVGIHAIGEEGSAELAGVDVGEADGVGGVFRREKDEVMRAAADEGIDAEADVAGGEIAFKGFEFVGFIRPGNRDRNEAAVLEPERILAWRGRADDVDGHGEVDAEGDVFGAEDVAFGGGKMALDLVVRKIDELDGGEL